MNTNINILLIFHKILREVEEDRLLWNGNQGAVTARRLQNREFVPKFDSFTL